MQNKLLTEEQLDQQARERYPDKTPACYEFRQNYKQAYWLDAFNNKTLTLQERIEARIHYLKAQECEEILTLDKAPANIVGTVHRANQWELIKAIHERRRELEELLK